MKKILKSAAKILAWCVLGAAALYLAAGFLLVPLAAPKLVAWQGSKLLGRPVTLKRAYFNPLTFFIRLSDFAIADTDKTVMAGFKTLAVDIDARQLVRKRFIVNSVAIDGLTLNIVLLQGNRINLMDLAPPAQEEPAPPAAGTQALPDVAVKTITLANGTITFADTTVSPGFTLAVHDAQARVTGISTRPDSRVTLRWNAGIDEKGNVQIDAAFMPFKQPLEAEASFTLNDYAARALSPYTGKFTGRAVSTDGKLDVSIAYRIVGGRLNAEHKLMAQRFDFAEKVPSKDALNLPFGLALALLKDRNGLIDISLPVSGEMTDPQFKYFHVLGQVAANLFMKLVTSPFKALTALVPSGGAETKELNSVVFAPGDTVIAPAQQRKLELLFAAMKERPGLSIEINGSYDPAADWDALKARAFEEEIAARGAASPAAYCAEKCVSLYEEEDLSALQARFAGGSAADEQALAAEMKRLVLEKYPADTARLKELARTRAQAVRDALVTAGCDPARIKTGSVRTALAILQAVPTNLTLTAAQP